MESSRTRENVSTKSIAWHHQPSQSSFAHANPIDLPVESSSESSSLLEKLVGDVVVAVSVTAVAAPFLTVIDKALVERSAGSHSVVSSMVGSITNMVRHPIAFLRSPTYLWMWGTYAATYSAANTLRTWTETAPPQRALSSSVQSNAVDTPPVSKTASTTLFAGTAVVNSSMSILKDRAYARMYGAATTTFAIPKISYGLWMVRDLTVIGAAFVLPTHVASVLVQHSTLSQSDATRVAQLATPVAVQVIAGPLHFVGYDYYNRPLRHLPSMSLRWAERVAFLRAGFVEVVSARMARILPGYGIAGVLNTELRTEWRRYVAIQPLLPKTFTWATTSNHAWTWLRSNNERVG